MRSKCCASRWLLRVTLAVSTLAFLGLAFATRVNAPVLDDFDAILAFANQFQAAHGPGERWQLVLAPHVDHRIAFTRAASLAVLGLAGRIDFAALSLLGAALLVALAFALALPRTNDDRARVAAAAVPLLLLQPQAFDVFHWPTASLATHAVLLSAWLAFRGLARGDRAGLAAALLATAVASLSQGNGVLVAPAGLAALLVARRGGAAARWAALSLPLVALYAITYRARSAEVGLAEIAARPLDTSLFFLNFLGAAPGFSNPIASPAIGALLCLVALALAARAARRIDVAVLALIAFVIATAATTAALRAGFGADYALMQPRYRSYSALLLALCHLGTSEWLRARQRLAGYEACVCALALLFCVASFAVRAPQVALHAEVAARSLARWSLTGRGLDHPRPERAGEVLSRALREGTLRIDPAHLARLLDRPVERAVPQPSGALQARVGRAVANRDFALVEGWALPRGDTAAAVEIFVVLEGESGRRVYTARQRAGADDPPRSENPAPRALAFQCLIARAEMPGEEVAVGVLLAEGSHAAFAPTGAVLAVALDEE